MNAKLRLALALLILATLPACSWDRRRPLTARGVTTPLPVHSENVIVYLEEVLPGRPLPQTIWDNTTGPIWNVAESHQIGFTQEYGVAVIAPPVVAATLVETRLVIPFGRSFAQVLDSALTKSYPSHTLCFDSACVERARALDGTAAVHRVAIDAFYAWEGPVNHLNFYVKGTSRLDGNEPSAPYAFTKEALQKSLGGFFTTHMAMIGVMNDLLGAFSEELSVEILTKGFD